MGSLQHMPMVERLDFWQSQQSKCMLFMRQELQTVARHAKTRQEKEKVHLVI
jgi:hypothetical protein